MSRPKPLNPSSLAESLLAAAAVGEPDAYYRLARMVARVLLGTRLRRRAKWCSLAQTLWADPGVEERLVLQSLRWLNYGQLPQQL